MRLCLTMISWLQFHFSSNVEEAPKTRNPGLLQTEQTKTSPIRWKNPANRKCPGMSLVVNRSVTSPWFSWCRKQVSLKEKGPLSFFLCWTKNGNDNIRSGSFKRGMPRTWGIDSGMDSFPRIPFFILFTVSASFRFSLPVIQHRM